MDTKMSSLSELGMLAAFSCNVEVIHELTHTCVYVPHRLNYYLCYIQWCQHNYSK